MMWGLDNRTAYSAERNWLRDKQGTHHWLVAVKATFDIDRGGKLTLADDQAPPLLAPRHRGEPGQSSLVADSDLLEVKPGTDVLVEAHAYAPKGKAVATVPVALRIGATQKVLVVHGTRVYYRGPFGVTASAPRPFTRRPIEYEWAFGGSDTSDPDPKRQRIDARNPVGRGLATKPQSLENQEAHAIEYPDGTAATAGPAGFGAIDRSWSPRLELAGTFDSRWEARKKPLLPDDYDERFGLCAPADQRPAKPLRGGEAIALLNMTPEGTLSFELPKILLTFRTYFGRRTEEHRATLATVFISAEERKVSLVWQTALAVGPRAVDYLDLTTIDEKDYLR